MDAEQLEQLSDEKSKKIVMRVSGVTIAGNLVLSLLKLLAGILESTFQEKNLTKIISMVMTEWNVWQQLFWQ